MTGKLDAALAPEWRLPLRPAAPLHLAVLLDNTETVAALLDAGADPNAADSDGWTSLHLAAALYDDAEVAAALLTAGADPDAADSDGETPLHEAARVGSAGTVAMLLDAGANPKAGDNDGETPLQAAAYRDDSEMVEVVMALLAASADR